MMALERDRIQRFIFDGLAVRGGMVRLNSSWQTVLERADYPLPVQQQLGQALAASVLLSTTIKFKGSLIIQAQGNGDLHTLVAQATHRKTIRGLAKWRGPISGTSLADIYGAGHLVLTMVGEGKDRYQGVVALEGDNLATALQGYFIRSEQLRTRFWLVADGTQAVGLLLQELPSEDGAPDDWERITLLADTMTDTEMLNLNAEELLYRLFHEDTVRLFEAETVSFDCGCSRQPIESTLRILGQAELEAVLDEMGEVSVACEFCNRQYVFDRIDVMQLFSGGGLLPLPPQHH